MSISQLARDLGMEDLQRKVEEGPKIPFFKYEDQHEEFTSHAARVTAYDNTDSAVENDPLSLLFDQFCAENTFQGIMTIFQQICDLAEEQPRDHEVFYHRLKSKIRSWKAQSLWTKLDKRASHKEYKKATCCLNTRVLIIGGGPCGLRTSIEMAFLGAKVVVVEKRDRFTRNNVLHLWPFLIHDLKALGAKKFCGKFCSGSIDHISIRALECILLKIALIVGVEIHPSVTFIDLNEPVVSDGERRGWRANVMPTDHPVSEYEFDVLIGADGKRNTLAGFKRREFRAMLAIGITANFINRNTKAENMVEEISGVVSIFNQSFFKHLKNKADIDLENIVYYKDDTHYFVMTAKKGSLLRKGVLKQDYDEPAQLLAKDNVNQEALLAYAREAADIATKHQLPSLDYAHNHFGQPDIAMFDFTSMFAACYASRVIERQGFKLLQGLAGDSLLEPFWPTGSGCGRAFLAAMDAAWMVRSWASGKMTPLEVMAERESIYSLLSQTPGALNKNHDTYTIDPTTRYVGLNPVAIQPHTIRDQYDGADLAYLDEIVSIAKQRSSQYEMIRDSHNLLKWFQRQLESYRHIVKIYDLSSSWQNGLALCSLIHKYRPELINVHTLDPSKVAENNQLAFDVAEKVFGIKAITTGEAMAHNELPDKLSMITYLSQFFEYFRKESVKPVDVRTYALKRRNEPRSPAAKKAFLNKMGTNVRQRCSKRSSDYVRRPRPLWSSSDDDDYLYHYYFLDLEKENESEAPKRLRPPFTAQGFAKKRVRGELPSSLLHKLEFPDEGKQQSHAERVRREMKALRPGIRGQNKVSSLAKEVEDKLTGKVSTTKSEDAQKPRVRPLIQKNMNPDVCYFCKKTVYIVERCTAEGLFFHRGCFRCEYCDYSLRSSAYSCLRTPGGEIKFYCPQHLGKKRPFRLNRRNLADNGTEAQQPMPVPSSIQGLPPGGTDQTDDVTYKPPERVEYMTESEHEESELEQTQYNLSGSLAADDNTDSEYKYLPANGKKSPTTWSSSSEDLMYEDSDNSDGDLSLIELARSYTERFSKSARHKRKKPNLNEDDDSGTETDTGTVGASDADWETESNTEKESDAESLFNVENRRPSVQSQQEMSGLERSKEESQECNREKLLLSPTALKPFGYTSFYKTQATEARDKKDTKPSAINSAILRKRMAFFDSVCEPVRIDAKSFLGLDRRQEEEKGEEAEVKEAQQDEEPKETSAVPMDEEPQEDGRMEEQEEDQLQQEERMEGEENKISGEEGLAEEEEKEEEEIEKKVVKKKRRHHRGDKHRLTGEVEESMLPGLHHAIPVITVGESSDEEDRQEDEQNIEENFQENEHDEEEEHSSGRASDVISLSGSDTEGQVESIEEMLASPQHEDDEQAQVVALVSSEHEEPQKQDDVSNIPQLELDSTKQDVPLTEQQDRKLDKQTEEEIKDKEEKLVDLTGVSYKDTKTGELKQGQVHTTEREDNLVVAGKEQLETTESKLPGSRVSVDLGDAFISMSGVDLMDTSPADSESRLFVLTSPDKVEARLASEEEMDEYSSDFDLSASMQEVRSPSIEGIMPPCDIEVNSPSGSSTSSVTEIPSQVCMAHPDGMGKEAEPMEQSDTSIEELMASDKASDNDQTGDNRQDESNIGLEPDLGATIATETYHSTAKCLAETTEASVTPQQVEGVNDVTEINEELMKSGQGQNAAIAMDLSTPGQPELPPHIEQQKVLGVESEKAQEQQQEMIPESEKEPEQIQEMIPESGKEPEQIPEMIPESGKEPEQIQEMIPESGKEPEQIQEMIPESGKEPEQIQEMISESGKEPEQIQEMIPGSGKETEQIQEMIPEAGKEPEQMQEMIPESGKEPEQIQEMIPESGKELQQQGVVTESGKEPEQIHEVIPESEKELQQQGVVTESEKEPEQIHEVIPESEKELQQQGVVTESEKEPEQIQEVIPESGKEPEHIQKMIPESEKEPKQIQEMIPESGKEPEQIQEVIPESGKEPEQMQEVIPESGKEPEHIQEVIPESGKEPEQIQEVIPESGKEPEQIQEVIPESGKELQQQGVVTESENGAEMESQQTQEIIPEPEKELQQREMITESEKEGEVELQQTQEMILESENELQQKEMILAFEKDAEMESQQIPQPERQLQPQEVIPEPEKELQQQEMISESEKEGWVELQQTQEIILKPEKELQQKEMVLEPEKEAEMETHKAQLIPQPEKQMQQQVVIPKSDNEGEMELELSAFTEKVEPLTECLLSSIPEISVQQQDIVTEPSAESGRIPQESPIVPSFLEPVAMEHVTGSLMSEEVGQSTREETRQTSEITGGKQQQLSEVALQSSVDHLPSPGDHMESCITLQSNVPAAELHENIPKSDIEPKDDISQPVGGTEVSPVEKEFTADASDTKSPERMKDITSDESKERELSRTQKEEEDIASHDVTAKNEQVDDKQKREEADSQTPANKKDHSEMALSEQTDSSCDVDLSQLVDANRPYLSQDDTLLLEDMERPSAGSKVSKADGHKRRHKVVPFVASPESKTSKTVKDIAKKPKHTAHDETRHETKTSRSARLSKTPQRTTSHRTSQSKTTPQGSTPQKPSSQGTVTHRTASQGTSSHRTTPQGTGLHRTSQQKPSPKVDQLKTPARGSKSQDYSRTGTKISQDLPTRATPKTSQSRSKTTLTTESKSSTKKMTKKPDKSKELELITKLERQTFGTPSQTTSRDVGKSKESASSHKKAVSDLISTKALPVDDLTKAKGRQIRDSIQKTDGDHKEVKSREDLQIDAIRRIDDLISSLTEEPDVSKEGAGEKMDTEEEEDYKEALDTSQIVSFTIDEETESPRTVTVNEKYINLRDRRRQKHKSGQSNRPKSSTAPASITLSIPASTTVAPTEKLSTQTTEPTARKSEDQQSSIEKDKSLPQNEANGKVEADTQADKTSAEDRLPVSGSTSKDKQNNNVPSKLPNGCVSDTLSNTSDQKSLYSNKSDSHVPSSPYSPNRLKDAKWRFFSEAPTVVRLDPAKLFTDMATGKTNTADSVQASNRKNIEKTLELNTDWKGLESITPTSPTAAVPQRDMASGENNILCPVQGKSTNGLISVDKTKVGQGARGVVAQEIKSSEDLTDLRKEQTASGSLSSEWDRKRPESALAGSHMSRSEKKEVPSTKRPTSAAGTLPLRSDSSTMSSIESPHRPASASDGTSTSDLSGASPNVARKGKKAVKDEKEGRDSDGKKEKKRSLLSIFLPSKSSDKKDKEKPKSPPPATEKTSFFKIKSPPLGKDRSLSPQGKKQSLERQDGSQVKLRSKSGAARVKEEETEQRRSIYDEFAPIVEDLTEGSKKNKEVLQEKLEQLAPPPAKAPYTSLRPPTATIDELETESEAGDDRMSVRSFQAITQDMTEEELAKMLKKQQKAVARRHKEAEQKRARKAHEIQRRLAEIEVKQRQVEQRGIEIEKALRGEGKDIPASDKDAGKDDPELMQKWLDIVHEKNMLVNHESDLLVQARELELEDRQSRLEQQLRDLFACDDDERKAEKKQEEEKVFEELLEVVAQRNALVALLDENRLKMKKEDEYLNDLLRSTGLELSPAGHLPSVQHSTWCEER